MKMQDEVTPPSKRERFTLRLMILLGLCSILYLLYCLFDPAQIGYAPFYWILMAGVTFNCLRVLHEWYHYYSISVPPVPAQQHPFTVDIFTTFCPGEPYGMIEETLTAIQAIRYPHTTWLCDEADDPRLKAFCEKIGVRHVTRANKIDAKAGNINNALQYATGELCVILDPDHVPAPDMLDRIVHHFNDEKIGYVQIVQAYSNLGDSLVAKGAAQQTFQFYGPIMSTMNSYGTVLAIGANCTFRRTALDSIGGHAAGLAEDMHTSMHLHAKGWKSIYVPAVLTRGLVPSTLSAYYSQQLKWARGTFELLVTSYPKLFRSFSWRQRLHYGTIPFHYFSGVIFFINFLIPILSLVTGLPPFRLDILNFAVIAMPSVAAIALIRHYVQRWVMEETERGFHIVGGLLMIGTWWIYILGLVYTLVRKKVPYIPTPKDDSEPDSWKLYIPNALILFASLGAIVYGLWYDWNPYSIIMAHIAGINCAIMLFNIIAGRRARQTTRPGWVSTALVYPLLLKRKLWLFRHQHVYTGFRKLGLPLLLTVLGITWYAMNINAEPSLPAREAFSRQQVFYSGIYAPGNTDGITSMQQVKTCQQQAGTHFNIISLYIPWGEAAQCRIQDTLMQSIYNNGSLPMITWEPWTNLFKRPASKSVFVHITEGYYDDYLMQFSQQMRALNRPVFLRFAHEADNPAYPWSNGTATAFRAAWKYVHNFFSRNDVNNVIWVWNPWSPQSVADYYPGEDYVDWIGVTVLNYGPQYKDGQSRSFAALYAPFHHQLVFRSGLPVMIAEMGSLVAAGNQSQWHRDAFSAIDRGFREVHAYVLFNSGQDKNVLRPVEGHRLNWVLQQPGEVFPAQARLARTSKTVAMQYGPIDTNQAAGRARFNLPDTIRGLNYYKGENWFRNFHALTRREVTHDLQGMKALGVNTIRRYGPGIYDRNILKAAGETGMNIHYGFWLGTDMTEVRILQRMKALKHEERIQAWHIGNTGFEQEAAQYFKPDLFYRWQENIGRLRKLIINMRKVDPSRLLTLDVPLTPDIAGRLQWLHRALPEVDAFGIVADHDSAGLSQLRYTNVPCFISQIPVEYYATTSLTSAFITTWQDLETRDYLTFDGLTDHWGRYKPSYYQLAALWGKTMYSEPMPKIKILRPSRTTFLGAQLTYHAIMFTGSKWVTGTEGQFTWHLVKTDAYGHPIFMKALGTGASITVSIPDKPEHYRLYLQLVNGDRVSTALSSLNTPL